MQISSSSSRWQHKNLLFLMALSRITKIHPNFCRIIKPTRPKCTNSQYNSSISSDLTTITNNFISIFTKQPFSPDNPQLQNLAPTLSTTVVETVLKSLKSWRIAHIFFTWASGQCGYKHNCYTYNAMASILSRARQIAPMRVLAMDIVNSSCSMSPGALGFFVRCLGSVGLVEEANVFFDQMKKMGLCVPNSYSYNCLLEAISKSGLIDLAEMRLKEMRSFGLQFDKYTFTPMLQVYCKAGKFDKALDVFSEIYERGWADAHVFSILLLSFSKMGEVDKVFELIERMEDRGIGLNDKTLYVLIHGFVRQSRVDRALQLFDKMRKLGFVPDISVYDALIGGLCKNKEFGKALCLYSKMKESNINPDVAILTKLVSSFSGGEMIQLLEERPENMDAETITLLYNSVLSGLINNGLMDKAYYLLRAMIGDVPNGDVEVDKLLKVKKMVHPDITSFSIVIDGLLKTGKFDVALILFLDMARVGCNRSQLLYNNLVDGLCNSNRLEESYELLREMKETGFEPTNFTHNSIFGCLCKREDTVGALDLVRKMRAHGHEPWIKHYTLLVKQLCKHGKVMEACNFLANMVEEGFLPDMIAYSAAIDGLIESKEMDRALELFRDICARGYCPDVVAYNILINGLCKAKRVSDGKDIMNEMVVKGLVPSVVTYNLLIDGWCKNGDIDQAMLCLSTMFGEEREPNVITYSTLIDGLCNARRPDDALVLWNEMGVKGCAPNRISFMALIHGLCTCGRPDAALVHFHEMEGKEMKPDTFIYVALIRAFISDLNLPSAFEILKEMIENGKCPDPPEKNYLIVRDAVLKLSKDARTSSSVKDLIAEGRIPTIGLSDIESEGGLERTI